MRANRQRIGRVLGSTILALTTIVTPVYADALTNQLNSAADALAVASAKATKAAKDLKAAQAQLPAARKALDAANAASDIAKADFSTAQATADAATAVYRDALTKVTSKEAEISNLQKQVDQFARTIYQQGQTSQLGVILNSTSPTDLALRVQAIRAVSQNNAVSLTNLVAAKEALAADAADAESKHQAADAAEAVSATALAKANAAADKAAKAKASVDKLVADESAALAAANQDKAETKAKYDALLAEQKRINAAAKGASKGSGNPQATGPLSWPLPGRGVGGNVGWRVHPVYGYKSCHTGTDVPAPSGTPIRVSAAGSVLSARWSVAYGNLMLVDHGNGLVTMYAHMTSFAVGNGASVANQQTIGYVGTTGWSTGPHLHYEVHINGTPYDPMGWFGGSRVPVSCWG